jgi:hypothetical protein
VQQEEMAIARQPPIKQAPMATDMHVTIKEVLEAVFYLVCARLHSVDHQEKLVMSWK